ncbi:MAG TPA: hypothetical protein VKG43_03260 [Acidimicrobiales bacterium]|nr:hypothetical protein [Acidimicrobiales bacterium]
MTDTSEETETPRPSRPIEVVAGAEPIKLGSILFTMVEPHRGHEVAYNRWYERDHFYSGCMIGPYQFAGRRFVATADLKALRTPDPSAITGEPARGSYVALYWVLDGYHDLWNRWAVRQVRALHAAGRMFEARDHVHTLLYRFAWEAPGDPEGVPVELALDHPYGGLVAEWIDRSPETSNDELWAWLRHEHLPGLLDGSPIGPVAAFTPLPLLIDAPGDVPRQEAGDARTLLLFFVDDHPGAVWPAMTEHAEAVRASGLATVVAAIPWKPTIPGTDVYTDQLWDD